MDIQSLEVLPPWEWPDEARDAVLSALLNGDADLEDRLSAVSLAGDLSILDDELALAIVAILKDGTVDPKIRARAAIALGPALENADLMGFDDDFDEGAVSEDIITSIQEELERQYRDGEKPKIVRRRILEAAVRYPQKWQPSMQR
jgi:hypothetical protein